MNIKALLGSAVVLAIVAYGATTSYLVHYDHKTAPKLSDSSPTHNDPKAKAAFATIAEARCDYCHSKEAKLPFYASLPVAKQLMQHDIEEGLRHFQIQPVLTALEKGEPVDEESLARIQYVVEHNMMPPNLYLFMHWHAALGKNGKKAMLEWIGATRIKNYDTAGVARQFLDAPIQPIPAADFSNKAKIALGEQLFFDKQLSGDGTLNCASCHGLNKGGVDNLVTATGIGGQKGPINVPTVYNSVYNKLQFWDGRAKDLPDQAAGPIMNPVEMGSHSWTEVSQRVADQPGYKAAFTQVYGNSTIDKERITDAIGAYEATLVTPDSRFDQYLKGNDHAITAQEKRGYALFQDLGCASCHVGKEMGGQSFEIMGLEGDYFGKRGHPTDADLGRFSQTHNDLDRHRFNVPTLRNIALTAPYFHDGSAKTLEDAVKVMVRYQTRKGSIPEQDINDIVAFLKAQTGTYRGHNLATITEAEADPQTMSIGGK
ncbi:cytochrome-c peroxidase [Zymomonas mobilis]|uniref:Cytochrome-c peroxidase n=1 Tax=Zymomonas mobilis subsp. pomaceae (strain ATCC 29192 / DSM 22645 / JCM 10191 / CCUG 17912 / NBRC 13757 / NCIMB 11200 / NRRL B-4491 / Barker I) TaxID=579138 RepID=F8ETQ4_ZYMMT|nr:cytochrome-c peroxidase [Zymomonas mobilis]AEI37064.1 Cytochrome-c peroxidase [Zymomonas mobilis subsp. pomaceae ATCC 29192]MDX5948435.1 cytochrome-c peroxidase [Zymomonas mobilis subsp. pomaceae]GEB89501.1 cytochrome-c peroxidase [Zymomonas mobilis subsp. pomaceae]